MYHNVCEVGEIQVQTSSLKFTNKRLKAEHWIYDSAILKTYLSIN